MKTHRLARVAEVVREVAASTILFDLRDPRVKNVTVTRAEVSADLQHAKVFVSVMGSQKQQRDAMYGLNNAAGFIQSKLADRLMPRFLPVLLFVEDIGVKKSIEVMRILAEERKLRGEAEPESSSTVDDTPSDGEDNTDEDAEADNADATDPAPGQPK